MKNIFDNIVDLYEYARPGYPQNLFEDIILYSGMNSSSRILEIGAGTGQATSFFANQGYQITALEIGERQVSYLAEKYKAFSNVCVTKNNFEDFSSDKKFDLLIAASSFHWIDEKTRYHKSYDLMNSGGTLAQFWHMHPVQRFHGGVFNKINEVYDRYIKNRKFYEEAELDELVEKRIHQLTYYGFKEICFYEYRYESLYSAYDYAALLSTYSYVQCLGEKKKEFLSEICKSIEKCGCNIPVSVVIHMYLAKKY